MLSTSLSVFGEKSIAQAHVVKSMHGIRSQAFCQTSDVMIARALLYEEAICETLYNSRTWFKDFWRGGQKTVLIQSRIPLLSW